MSDQADPPRAIADRFLRWWAALTALALVGVVAAGAVIGSERAADDLEPRARAALDAAGLVDVNVEMEGREAALSQGTRRDLGRAKRVVEGVRGIRWATVDLDSVPDGAYVDLAREGRRLRIRGTVPEAGTAASIKAAAAETFGLPVVGDLRIDPQVPDAEWTTLVTGAFGDLAAIKDIDLSIHDGTLELGGRIESGPGREKVLDLLASNFPGLTVDDRIKIDPGTLPARDATVINTATLYFPRGGSALSAENTAVLDDVAAVLRDNPDVKIEAGGHAGPSNPEQGQKLSQRRVAAVKDHLVAAGIADSRISVTSYGSAQETGTDVFAKQYRRVDFVVKGN